MYTQGHEGKFLGMAKSLTRLLKKEKLVFKHPGKGRKSLKTTDC